MSEFRKDFNEGTSGMGESKSESLRHRMRDTANQAREAVDEKLRTASQQVSQKAERINEAIHENVEKIRSMKAEDLERAWDGVKAKARDNPTQTMMIAAAAGFMVGVLFHAATSHKH